MRRLTILCLLLLAACSVARPEPAEAVLFTTATCPTSGATLGDECQKKGDGKKYYYNGSAWIETIANQQTPTPKAYTEATLPANCTSTLGDGALVVVTDGTKGLRRCKGNKLIYENEVNVLEFAAADVDIGDGTTNASTAFAAAIAALPPKGKLKVPTPTSLYKFDTGITISKHINLVGDAPDIGITCADGITCITISATDWRGKLGNFLILNGAKGVSITSGLFDVSSLRDLTFFGQTSKAIEVTSTGSIIQADLRNISIDAAGGDYGLWVEGSFVSQASIIENLHCTGAAIQCVHIKHTGTGGDALAYGPTFFHPTIEGNGGVGMYLYGVRSTIYDWYSEGNGYVTDGKDIEIDGDPLLPNGVILVNPVFQGSPRASYPTVVKFLANGSYVVHGNGLVGNVDANNKIVEIGFYGQSHQPSAANTVLNGGNSHVSFYGNRVLTLGHAETTGSNIGDVILTNSGCYRFLNNAGTSSANYGLCGNSTDDLRFVAPNVGTANGRMSFAWWNGAFTSTDYMLQEENAAVVHLYPLLASTIPATPSTSTIKVFPRTHGGANAALGIRFATGWPNQVLASEAYKQTKTLTDNVVTAFTNINFVGANAGTIGGRLGYNISAWNATDYQSRTGFLTWTAVNKAGTVTCALSTVGAATEVVAVSAGTLANTFTCVPNGNSIDLKAQADTSLTPTGMEINYWVEPYQTAYGMPTVTPR
jgi:hypothetical protein